MGLRSAVLREEEETGKASEKVRQMPGRGSGGP
jgi:hypothetical protein